MMPSISSGPHTRQVTMAALALLAGACGPSYSSDRDDSIPIPKAATYVWVGRADVGHVQGGGGQDPEVQNQIVHQRIQNAINSEMKVKGYTLVSNPEAAEFFVRYYVGLRTETSYMTTTTGVGYGPGWGWGWGGYGMAGGVTTTTPIETTKGTFLVDLVQRSSGKLAWRGTIQGDAPDKPPTQEQVNRAITKVMTSLPVVPS